MKLLKAVVLAAFFSSTGHGFGISVSKIAIQPVFHAIAQVVKAGSKGTVGFGNHRSSLSSKTASAQ